MINQKKVKSTRDQIRGRNKETGIKCGLKNFTKNVCCFCIPLSYVLFEVLSVIDIYYHSYICMPCIFVYNIHTNIEVIMFVISHRVLKTEGVYKTILALLLKPYLELTPAICQYSVDKQVLSEGHIISQSITAQAHSC